MDHSVSSARRSDRELPRRKEATIAEKASVKRVHDGLTVGRRVVTQRVTRRVCVPIGARDRCLCVVRTRASELNRDGVSNLHTPVVG